MTGDNVSMVISSFAEADLPVPADVQRISRGAPVEPVWVNGDGGMTFRIGAADEVSFAKWAPAGSPIDLRAEMERMLWASRFAAVPRVLDFIEVEGGTCLLTAGLPGESAIVTHWKAHPDRAVAAAGSGLRALHDALPVDTCPFDWSVDTRIAQLELSDDAARTVPPAPPTDRLVVCHGDACVPNTLISRDGQFAGHVDLGSLGRADRWADLAVATWSTEWNFGPGWEELFLRAYGVDPDAERTWYYRTLWDLAHPE